MSGDFENWNQSPADRERIERWEKEVADYNRRAAWRTALVWILAFGAIAVSCYAVLKH